MNHNHFWSDIMAVVLGFIVGALILAAVYAVNAVAASVCKKRGK